MYGAKRIFVGLFMVLVRMNGLPGVCLGAGISWQGRDDVFTTIRHHDCPGFAVKSPNDFADPTPLA